ncbi:tripartite tricarboxylate transporter permease [Halobaculum sp. CBA1158]|uniref:tripartite tricarboxylate transporter permease n=1 Tax=Halobaculum sp. CBA1158 TaxID=2904243 RepID=UPI001F48F31A|nr:tripartite tricarboxylate transporter permease [Halobaculum sp. CBA1158]UIO98644.1 tripartite tricarboxylate transporter permease [Halobaculum sp. CBA1158]
MLSLTVPSVGATLLAYTLAGCALGCCSGLLPGLHANNFAFLLAAAAPAVDAPPLPLGCAMLSAGIVHTFLDVVPSLALGVPDAAMAAAALPGHRLVAEGRGREALRLSAIGSGVALAGSIPLAVAVTAGMRVAYPYLRAWLPVVLGGVALALVVTEATNRRRIAGTASFALATALGAVTLDAPTDPLVAAGGILAPLFAGLFGVPVLADALGGDGVPPQADARLGLSPREVTGAAAAGAGGGAAVGYLPGVSAGVAAVLALPATRGRDPAREYVVATSGANTATAVFALFALVAFDAPRSGVLVAMRDAGVPATLPPLLAATVVAGAVGVVAVVAVGEAALRAVGRLPYRPLVAAVLTGLVVLSLLFAGPFGVVTLVAAAAVGFVPVRLGCRRVHLMGVLLGPLILA